jgi:hypothetical protein
MPKELALKLVFGDPMLPIMLPCPLCFLALSGKKALFCYDFSSLHQF